MERFPGDMVEGFWKCWGGIELKGRLLTEIPPAVFIFFLLLFSFFSHVRRNQRGSAYRTKETERPGNIQTPRASFEMLLLINKGDSN